MRKEELVGLGNAVKEAFGDCGIKEGEEKED